MNVEVNHPNLYVDFRTERVYPELEDLEATPITEEQNFKSEKYGFDNVKVKAIETEEVIIEPRIEAQSIEPTEGKFINKVIVEEVTASIDPHIEEENIKAGVNILGKEGTFTNDATATAEDLMQDKTAYVNGEKITGTLVPKEIVITPTEEEQVFTGLFDKVTCEGAELAKPIDLPFEFEIDNVGNYVEINLYGNNTIKIENDKKAIITVNEKNNVSVIEKEKTYTELNYIETTGTQYIDTGVALFNYSSWEIQMDYMATSLSTQQYLYSTASGNSNYECYYQTGGNILAVYNGGKPSTKPYAGPAKTRFTINVKYSTNLQVSVTGDTTKTSSAITTALLDSPLYLLRKSSTYAKGRLYGAKLYANGELIREYIPVKDLTGVPCLYDKVTGTFLYNAGTGNFIAG